MVNGRDDWLHAKLFTCGNLFTIQYALKTTLILVILQKCFYLGGAEPDTAYSFIPFYDGGNHGYFGLQGLTGMGGDINSYDIKVKLSR